MLSKLAFRAYSVFALLFFAVGVTVTLGCGGRSDSTVIEPPPGSKILSEEELAAENAQRTLEMSGAAAEMGMPQGQ